MNIPQPAAGHGYYKPIDLVGNPIGAGLVGASSVYGIYQ